jgi:putative two-component system response regulator
VKRKILIIDDEPSTLEMLQDFLRDEYEVTVADNVTAGTQDLLGQSYDLLILDVRLPGMEAYEYLQTLIAGPHCADLPVLLVSADREVPRRFEHGPQREYLPKPLRRGPLFASIERLIDHH